jgi:4-hydroxy-3-polyprenylbenzoate decarboxylase
METRLDLVRALRGWYARRTQVPWALNDRGPVLQNVATGAAVDVEQFPAPVWHERDGGPFIGTADVVIMRDPDTGWVNAGTYRAQVYDGQSLGLVPLPGKHGHQIIHKYWARGEPCPVAISVGQDPLLFLLAGMEAPAGVSELEYAGGVKGRPLEVVAGPTTGLPVPAGAELVLEGEIRPDHLRVEGPFGEWSGYYVYPASPQPVVTLTAILHRDDPIILGGMPGPLPSDNTYFRCYFKAAHLWDELEAAGVEGIRGVWQHIAGGSRLFAVISLKQLHAGHARRAGMLATFCRSAAYTGRFTIVVDEDIDPTDTDAVLWALSTRVDPRTDIELFHHCWGSPSDTICYPEDGEDTDLFTSRVVIDATRPWLRRKTFPPVAAASSGLRERVLRDWTELFARRRAT